MNAGEIRQKLKTRYADSGQSVTQAFVAEWSEEFLEAPHELKRQTISAIEAGSSREVGLQMVARYIDVVRCIAEGKTGLSPQWDLVHELEDLRRQLAPGTAPPERREERATDAALDYLEIPSRTYDSALSPPGALLRAEYGIVPFHGRAEELEDLLAWTSADRSIGIRLYTGPGGMGKTRLLIETCTALSKNGWATGFLSSRTPSTPDVVEKLWRVSSPVLVVLDYAETRRDLLTTLLSTLYESGREHPARVVLLARAADDWWHQLKAAGDHAGELIAGPATERISLRALALDTAAREKSYVLAGQSFAAALSKQAPPGTPDDLDEDHYQRVLLLHMHALSAVDGVVTKGEQGILDFVLNRERRFWGARANAVQLPEIVHRAIGQAMATITLTGGVSDETEAIALIERLPFLQGQPRAVLHTIVSLLHEIYPGERWIEPIMPDLLGEHLVQTELATAADAIFDIVLGEREPE